jgi:hypothetical protein
MARVAPRSSPAGSRALVVRREQLHQTIGVRIRQRPQQQGTDHAEDGGRGTDAEGEREHGDDREAGRTPERPDTMRHISPGVVDPGERACVAMQVLRLCDAAHRAPRGETSLVRTQAAAAVLVLEKGEVRGDFSRDLGVGALTAKDVQDSTQDATHVTTR